VLGHYRLYRAQFVGAKPKIACQLNRLEPELSRQVLAIDMNVGQFVGFVAIKNRTDKGRTGAQSACANSTKPYDCDHCGQEGMRPQHLP